jgi:hypothetical protein
MNALILFFLKKNKFSKTVDHAVSILQNYFNGESLSKQANNSALSLWPLLPIRGNVTI